MIQKEEILSLHRIAIKQFGGTEGVRDHSLLDSAIHRPFHTFQGEDLYPSVVEKACALIESIVKNHPFLDGNKRTGYLSYRLFLLNHGFSISASEAEKYQMVIEIAEGKLMFDDIVGWTRQRLVDFESI